MACGALRLSIFHLSPSWIWQSIRGPCFQPYFNALAPNPFPTPLRELVASDGALQGQDNDIASSFNEPSRDRRNRGNRIYIIHTRRVSLALSPCPTAMSDPSSRRRPPSTTDQLPLSSAVDASVEHDPSAWACRQRAANGSRWVTRSGGCGDKQSWHGRWHDEHGWLGGGIGWYN